MKKKINIRFIMIAALAIVVTALSAMLVYYNILKEQVFGDLKAYAHVIELLNIDDLAAGIEKDPYNPIDDDLRITLIGAEGEVLYESLLNKDEMDNHNERPEIIEAREKGEGEAIRYSATSGTHTFYYAERLQNGNVLRIGRDSVSVNRIMVNTLVIVLVIALCILFVCMGISHYLTKKLVEPIEKLATNIMLVDENNVYEEIRPFVNTIKEQHVNIINNAQLRQEFTANVSHELKTPLTAISGYAELIGNGMTGKEDTIRFSNEIHSNANRLLSLINDIIKLSELDEADHQMEMEKIDLYKLAENCVQMMQVTAEKQGIRLTLQGESAMVMANKGLMDEVFYNLCSNAIRYNKPGGSVTVTVGTKDERPFLSVADTGIGIPKECQERVFERFYRVDKSRSKSTGGTGLGLAIVKHIVAQHNAALHLDSELGEGTTIEIVF
ncbi:MAG: ATP-binding protein [Lachnospiraceae bacterium]|jgi:two-component system phosphate regulon sensor histidine kinase PhoR|nr:ATP-binding protein [Lachnospiraceae bacterium]